MLAISPKWGHQAANLSAIEDEMYTSLLEAAEMADARRSQVACSSTNRITRPAVLGYGEPLQVLQHKTAIGVPSLWETYSFQGGCLPE